MKEHSQRLNIKTTWLASLTAVFCPKKRAPPVVDEAPETAMDVDNLVPHPEQDSQVGGFEAIPQEPASSSDDDETDDAGSGSDGVTEGSLRDSDSENEFESDKEDGDDERDGDEGGQGIFDFELKAAEAGDVHS